MSELSWEPAHKGNIYCSPACGGNCTKAAYDEAHRKGKKLAKRMGKSWTVRVWENLGWHYSAISPDGCTKIRENCYNGRYSYMAFIGVDKWAGGVWAEHGKTPQEALRNTLAVARAEIAEKQQILEALKDW